MPKQNPTSKIDAVDAAIGSTERKDRESQDTENPTTPIANNEPAVNDTRQQLLVNVVVFQLKLFLDSARDLILSPLSIAALILGMLFGGNRPMQYFSGLLQFGRRTEAWINLFGRYSSVPDSTREVPTQNKNEGRS